MDPLSRDPRAQQPTELPFLEVMRHSVVCVVLVHVGKEFPEMRRNERRTNFIRVGDAVRTVCWLKGERNPFAG